MSLDESQRTKVAQWIAEGLKLSEIQNRLASELGVRLTYMEVRLLVDDLKLTPKDTEPAKPEPVGGDAKTRQTPADQAPLEPIDLEPTAEPAPAPNTPGEVSVVVDHLTKPGAVVSGMVTFSDGNKAQWYLDQSGRLGLAPEKAGYRPPASDVQKLLMALETEFSRMGF